MDNDLEARFWSQVARSDDGCWLWRGPVGSSGYGHISRAHWLMRAHRLSWEIHHGPIPDGLCVLHRCDVKTCVRPDHLWLGTKGDNIRDCVAKGRYPIHPSYVRGEAHWHKLTEASVREIRTLYASGTWSMKRLARRYGVSDMQISNVVRRRQWNHVL